MDFGSDVNYNIKQLSLQNTGDICNSNWKDDKSELNLIVEQLVKSNVHNQLQKFNIKECNADIKDIDLPGVKIVEEANWF